MLFWGEFSWYELSTFYLEVKVTKYSSNATLLLAILTFMAVALQFNK